ncbi:MAG TPA: glycosyltransferase [Leeuwenhoekiella sp.]|nr:glycosyltransferase [Leeuwenhoekiella sp.]
MNSYLYRILRKSKLLPQKLFVNIHYKYHTGKTLNLENPKNFNEKIQWLKIYYKPSILTQLVDKYEVRSYVSEKVGDKYLNDLYSISDSADAFNFDVLPQRFVLKATHGYDMNIIVKDKKEFNEKRSRELARQWLSINHYYHAGMEWAYKNIKPRLIAEKLLEEKGKDYINDYKFFCFNGQPKFLKVDLDRGNDHCQGYYDTEWNQLPFEKKGGNTIKETMEKPHNFEEMVQVARKLSGDFPFVRVDLYNLDGKIVFGEMTFYPADGRTEFEPAHYNRVLGDYIKLPKIPEGLKAITCLSQHVRAENA